MKIRIIFVLIILFSINSYSQEIDSLNQLQSDYLLDLEIKDEESEVDEESIEIGAKNEEAIQSVKFSEELLSYINLLRDKDSLVYHFSKTIGENEILPTVDQFNKLNIERMYEVIFHPNTNKVMYVREMILNENQAWDYIYENIFDLNGKERLFIRHYSTFNSVCAEVAFELSEYFFNEQNELIRKTYSIVDGQHNPININDCWMDREEYLKYKNFDELNSNLKLNLSGLPKSNSFDKEDLEAPTQEEISEPINVEKE